MATIHLSQSLCHNHNVDTLKVKLQEALENVGGQVWIIPEAELRTDSHVVSVDIILIGYLKGYGSDKKNFSFVTTVEVKHHLTDKLYVEGDKLFTKYADHVTNVTDQSQTQKYTVIQAIKNATTYSPYVTSLIWLDSINEEDTQSLAGLETSIIGADFSAEDLLNKIIIESAHTEEEMAAIAELLGKAK